MPHRPAAAILIQLDKPHPDKQTTLCLEYTETSGLRAQVLCHLPSECLAMVMAGTVKAVITAVDPGGQLGEDLARFGGTLHVVREVRTRRRLDVRRLVERMRSRGLDSQEIAAILDVDTKEIRRAMFRSRPPSD